MSFSIINKSFYTVLFSLLLLITFNCTAQEKFGGLALYTVRDAMSNDPKGTLKAVADAGYTYFEAAGYDNGKFYGMSPKDFKALSETFGLIPLSSHQGGITLKNLDQMIIDVKAAGFKYFVIPVPPMDLFKSVTSERDMSIVGDPEQFVFILNTIGEKCKKAGLLLLYHNHDFEFKKGDNGEVVLNYVIEHTNPDFVNFEMDLYWVTKAGGDPVAYFEKYPGRFKMWHVKDMDDQGRFSPVGKGNIDFGRILAKKDLSGMNYYMVEQDNTFDISPIDAIKISHEGLKTIGFK